MVTCNKYADRPNRSWMELYGLSTDEKPKEAFIYDEENKKWWEV